MLQKILIQILPTFPEPSDLCWNKSALSISSAELTIVVVAPTADTAIGQHSTSVHVSRGKGDGSWCIKG